MIANKLKNYYLIIFLVFAGCVLRIYGVGEKSFWFDESLVLLEARQDVPVLMGERAEGIHPPLYRLLLHFWMKLGEGEVFLRLPSVFLSSASILVCFLIALRIIGRNGAFFAAALMAFSPFQIYYAQEVKMYALFLFLSLVSVYFFINILEGDRRFFQWAGYVCFTILALYTHYFAFWLVLCENVVILMYARQLNAEGAGFRKWLMSQIAVFIFFLPWVYVFIIHLGKVASTFWTPPVTFSAFSGALRSFILGYYTANLGGVVPELFFLLFFIAGFIRMFGGLIKNGINSSRSRAVGIVFLCVPVIGVWVVSLFFRFLFLERALIFITCFYYCILWEGINCFKKYRPVFLSMIFIIAGLLAMSLYNAAQNMYFSPSIGVVEKKPLKQLLAYILSGYKENEPVALAHCSLVYPFKYYAPVSIQKNLHLLKNSSENPGDQSTLHGIKETFGIKAVDIEEIPGSASGLWVICSGWGMEDISCVKLAKDWLDKRDLIFKNTAFDGFEVYYYRSRTEKIN